MKKQDTEFTLHSWFKSEKEYLELMDIVFDNTNTGILVTDKNGVIIRINSKYEAVCGYKPEEMIGKSFVDLDKVDPTPSASMRVIATGEPIIEEQYCENGRNYLVYSFPVFDENGDVKYVINNLFDATKMFLTQQELVENREVNEELHLRIQQLEKQLSGGQNIVFKSKVMLDLLETCEKVAKYDSTILITGESGTGKEVIANYICDHSRRKDKPFIKVNCASIPETLMESEFFGYEAGAFTGANAKGKPGLVEMANGGTLLLDEVSEIPLFLQAKMLRFLQEGQFYRVGGEKPISTDVRVIAATNRDIGEMVEDALFRRDLYYRLNVLPIFVPPLRDRTEDIPLLVDYAVKNFNRKYGTEKVLANEVMHLLVQREYTGNVRELFNVVERLLLMAEERVTIETMQEVFPSDAPVSSMPEGKSLKEITGNFEKKIIKEYLQKYKTASQVAKVLGTDQTTISRKIKKYGL